MAARREREIGIRLSVKDEELVKRALKAMGAEGEVAFNRLSRSAQPVHRNLMMIDGAVRTAKVSMLGLWAGLTAGLLPIISVAGAINGAREAMQQFGDIADKSKSAGVDAEFFQGLAYQAKLAGVEIGELSGALDTYNKNSGQAVEGRGRMVTALKAENAELLENIRNARTQEERVRLSADAINNASSASEKAALAAALYGDAGVKMVAVFEGGAKAIDETMKKARELGIIIDRETIARADELGDKFDTVTQILDLQFKRAVIELAPFLVNFAQNIASIVNALGDLIERYKDVKELSKGELNQRLAALGADDLALENSIIRYQGRLGKPGEADWALEQQIAKMKEQRARIQADQQAALAQLTLLDGQKPDAVNTDDTDLPPLPPIVDPETKSALKEAEALMKRLRTASEEYAATIDKLDTMRSQGLISQTAYNRAVAEAAVTFAGAADGSKEYAAALAELDEAKAKGILSEKQYTAAVDDLTKRRLVDQNDWIAGVQLGLMQIKEGAKSFSTDLASAINGWADNLASQLGEVFKTGKFEWRDLIATMLADVARISTQQLITRPLAGLLSSIVSGALGGGAGVALGGGGVSGLGGIGGGVSAFVHHLGGPAGDSGAARRLTSPFLFMNAKRLHNGLASDEVPAILQRGEEVVPKGGRRSGLTVNINFAPVIEGSGLNEAALDRVLDNAVQRLEDRVPDIVHKAWKNGKG